MQTVGSMVIAARHMCQEFIQAIARPVGCAPHDVPVWLPSPTDKLKVNIDAEYVASLRTTKCGFVVRDEDGRVMLSGNAKFRDILSLLHAEIHAILFGVETLALEQMQA
ncbi:hypothetical protein PTKIN_Ptkin18bG0088600 [Pterospermum kingtungense]